MPLSISRLRRWFAAGAVGLLLVVAAVYFYARHQAQNALKEVPGKIGLEVQQSAQGFTVSRSEQGHTLFKVQASKAVQFKQGGRTELHDVTITLYGRDSARFDQIYGADFEYDPQSGDVVGKGQVQMDLEANPEGLLHPDQATPKELKNPIHLTTTDLLFNQKTGNASTREKVEFSIPPSGNVRVESEGIRSGKVQSNQLELLMADRQDALRTAIFSGDVRIENSGAEPMQGSAGRVVLNFAGTNVLTTVHGEENVKLVQHQKPATASAAAQEVEVTAAVIDFKVADGSRLERADTSGAAQIALRPNTANAGQTLVTAGKFQARFDDLGQLASVHGTPDARITSQTPGQPDRVSTSNTLDASFRPATGIDSIVQQGSVAYKDGDRRAWAELARYTPADQMLVLTGSPRVVDGGMTTTARTMRLNRTTGDAFADGEVKSTYSDLKAEPNGALLASSDPIHVTARTMTAHSSPAVALYTGDARLWQNANVIEAPSIEFDRNHRSVVARGTPAHAVSTVLVQTEKSGKVTPVKITSTRFTYNDEERKAHFEGAVQAKGPDLMIAANAMDVFLHSRDQATPNQALAGTGKIDRIIANDHVVITQPNRTATGDQLVYTSSDDKFVLSGGPPSIFDAEQGKITGVSLTLFRHDGRVLVEGSSTSPTVTQTRVAR